MIRNVPAGCLATITRKESRTNEKTQNTLEATESQEQSGIRGVGICCHKIATPALPIPRDQEEAVMEQESPRVVETHGPLRPPYAADFSLHSLLQDRVTAL